MKNNKFCYPLLVWLALQTMFSTALIAGTVSDTSYSIQNSRSVFLDCNRPLKISIFSNATAMPFQSPFPVHPGLKLASDFRLNKSRTLRQNVAFDCYYHNYSQMGFKLYSEFEFHFYAGKRFDFSIGAGPGYMLSATVAQSFTFEEDKGYVKETQIRNHFMISSGLAASYSIKPAVADVFVSYQFWMMMPYVEGYVPVLPNVAWHCGIAVYPFK